MNSRPRPGWSERGVRSPEFPHVGGLRRSFILSYTGACEPSYSDPIGRLAPLPNTITGPRAGCAFQERGTASRAATVQSPPRPPCSPFRVRLTHATPTMSDINDFNLDPASRVRTAAPAVRGNSR